jgi:hypothetical protein
VHRSCQTRPPLPSVVGQIGAVQPFAVPTNGMRMLGGFVDPPGFPLTPQVPATHPNRHLGHEMHHQSAVHATVPSLPQPIADFRRRISN